MIESLDAFYETRGRDGARRALAAAETLVADGTDHLYDAPALDPMQRAGHPLRRPGLRWIRVAGYWIGYRPDLNPRTIVACLHQNSPGIGPFRRSERGV